MTESKQLGIHPPKLLLC